MINEVAQWCVLAFLSVFVVGLTRHLGRQIVSERDRRAAEYGPDEGHRLPRELLANGARAQLDTLFAGAPWAVFIVVNPMCDACETWLDRLREDGSPAGAPLVLLSRRGDAEFVSRLHAVGDVVVLDETGDALRDANLIATPFLMVVDADLRVRFKQLGGDPQAGVARWRSKNSIPMPEPKRPALV